MVWIICGRESFHNQQFKKEVYYILMYKQLAELLHAYSYWLWLDATVYLNFSLSFGLSQQYPLCTLLVFDSSHNAIPIAWVITSSFVGQDIHKWIGLLAERIHTKDPGWRLNAFLADDPSFKVSMIR